MARKHDEYQDLGWRFLELPDSGGWMAYHISQPTHAIFLPDLDSVTRVFAEALVATAMREPQVRTLFSAAIDALETIGRPGARRATNLALALPTATRRGSIMTSVPLLNDQVLTIGIHATGAGGEFEPAPSGDTFTATSSDPSALQAVIGKDAGGNAALVVNALKAGNQTVTVTISDSAGLAPVTQDFDIVADTAPVALALDVTGATHTSQAVPTA